MSSRGWDSAIAIAARSPAPPPPTSTTSCAATGSLLVEELVHQHLAVVPDDAMADTAVVVFVVDEAAAAGEVGFFRHHDFGIVVPIVEAIDDAAAWGLLGLEGAGCYHDSPPCDVPGYPCATTANRGPRHGNGSTGGPVYSGTSRESKPGGAACHGLITDGHRQTAQDGPSTDRFAGDGP